MFNQDTHKIMTEEEKTWLKDSLLLDVKASQIKKVMNLKFNKTGVSTKHVRYVMQKLKCTDNEKEELATFLENLEDEGGQINVLLDEKENVRVLSVQTSDMRRAFLGVNPDVVMVDTTFNYNASGYKLNAFSYVNPVSNRGEVANLVFLSDEGAETLEFGFTAFRKAVLKDPGTFMLDKDFTELSVLAKVFPNSNTLLCLFHVLKYWKSLVNTARAAEDGVIVDCDKKLAIMELFRGIVYEVDSDICEKLLTHFESQIQGIEVRVGNGDRAYHVKLADYFHKNWKTCDDKWMTCKRRRTVGLEQNTNNSLERLWRSMKDHLKQMSSGSMSIAKAVLELVKYSENRLEDSYTWDQRHFMRIHDKDEDVKRELASAAWELNDRGLLKFKHSMELLRSREGKMEIEVEASEMDNGVKEWFKRRKVLVEGKKVKDDSDEDEDQSQKNLDRDVVYQIYNSDDNKCNCTWAYRSGVPCRHILYCRRSMNLPLFQKSLFHERFWKNRNQDLDRKDEEVGVDENNNSDNEDALVEDEAHFEPKPKIMNKGDKYRLISPLTERLLDAILRCGSNPVKKYQEELEEIIENVRDGRSLFFRAEKKTENVSPENEGEVKNSVIDDTEIAEKPRKKFDLKFYNKTKTGKVGRPSESKVRFKKKTVKSKIRSSSKVKKRNEKKHVSEGMPSSNKIVCSFPPNPHNPKQFAVYEDDYKFLAPRVFISNDIIDFKFRYLQPDGPAGKRVWLLNSYLAQQMAHEERWWVFPGLKRQVDAARIHEEGGCQIIVMAWCESSHFFGVIAVCGEEDNIYVMESIGGYREPRGVAVLHDFLRGIRSLKKLDPSNISIKTLNVPKQEQRSNNCGMYLMENASMILNHPDDFIFKAQTDSLLDWYPTALVSRRREEMADLLKRLGHDQRRPGELHETEGLLDLPDLGFKECL